MKTQISLIYGGRSTEHDCSVSMYRHFRVRREEILARFQLAKVIYIDISGEVTVLACRPGKFPKHEDVVSSGVKVPSDDLPKLLKMDNVFLFSLLQGQDGEDGRFQAISEFFDLKSSCGHILTNAVGNDKFLQHQIAVSVANDLTPVQTLMCRSRDPDPAESDLRPFIGRECVLKPNTGGGSFLTELVSSLTEEDVESFAGRAWPFCDHFLVQRRVAGRDVTCGVLHRHGRPKLLPVAVLETASNFFGYEEKWIKDVGYEVNFDALTDEVAERIRRITGQLVSRFDYHTCCRFDYMLGENGDIHFLEVNTGPGLTEASIYPKMLARGGLSLTDLLSASMENEGRNVERRKEFRQHVQSVRVASCKGHGELAA